MMKLAIQTPQEEYAKNTEIISSCIETIKIKIPALDEYSQWIDDLVKKEDLYKCALDLKALLLKLSYTSLTEENILKAKEEINRMINLLGPTEEESSTIHRISRQYYNLLCELKDLVEIPLFTCWRSNSAIARSYLIP